MKLSKQYTRVTPFSKFLAMILFIALPFIGFALGMKLQASLDKYNTQTIIIQSYPRLNQK